MTTTVRITHEGPDHMKIRVVEMARASDPGAPHAVRSSRELLKEGDTFHGHCYPGIYWTVEEKAK